MKNTQQLNQKSFNDLIQQIQKNKASQIAIRAANKVYDIKNFKVTNITIIKAKKIYTSMIEKYRLGNAFQQSWLQNQRRLYLWLLLCFIYLNNKTIQTMTLDDFSLFSTIFNNKQQSFLKFQAFALIKKQKNQRKWTQQEDQLLYNIIIAKPEQYQKQWNQISKVFFNQSGQKFHRNAKQCRERWFNHLDPHKVRGKWTIQQDLILLKNVKENGKKWSQIISKLGDCKTQHMIKNRYNSLINKKKKQLSTKNQEKILNKLIQQCETLHQYKEKQQYSKKSQKQSKSNKNSEAIKQQKNQEINFQPGIKKIFVQRVGSLSMSEKGGMLPELANPIMEEMDSAEERQGFKFFSLAPNSQGGYSNSSCNKFYDLRSPFVVSSPFNTMGNSGNITPSMFFLQQNAQKQINFGNQAFTMSFSSNFDKFIPESKKTNE